MHSFLIARFTIVNSRKLSNKIAQGILHFIETVKASNYHISWSSHVFRRSPLRFLYYRKSDQKAQY